MQTGTMQTGLNRESFEPLVNEKVIDKIAAALERNRHHRERLPFGTLERLVPHQGEGFRLAKNAAELPFARRPSRLTQIELESFGRTLPLQVDREMPTVEYIVTTGEPEHDIVHHRFGYTPDLGVVQCEAIHARNCTRRRRPCRAAIAGRLRQRTPSTMRRARKAPRHGAFVTLRKRTGSAALASLAVLLAETKTPVPLLLQRFSREVGVMTI